MATRAEPRSYLLISLECGPDGLEAAAAALIDLGAEGVIEEETASGSRVKAYFPAEDWPERRSKLEERLRRVREHFPSLRLVEERSVVDADWLENWKEFHRPVIVGRLWIGPPWQVDLAPAELERVVIDPGRAFGTGAHATTLLCLEFLAEMAGEELPAEMLDVGVDSGVLALAALKLGVGRVLGADIDPQALDAAARNAALNGLENRLELTDRPIDRIGRDFPLVTANLTGPIHLALSRELIELTRPGGRLIAGGMLNEETEKITAAYQEAMDLTAARRRDEWAGLAFTRRRDRKRPGEERV